MVVTRRKTSVDTDEESNNNVPKSKKGGKDKIEKSNDGRTSSAIWIIFGSLLFDLLAFTMILPLFPALLDYYKSNGDVTYKYLESSIQYFQKIMGAPDRFNSVLFGGFLGSMFSFLQFLASPLVGGLSDSYGRKPVLLVCLGGICFSYVLWALSESFTIFIIARIVGGISKGNVSLSMAIISDVSTVATRGRGMALVGIAFSVGFIIGPVIGAIFAKWAQSQSGDWYIVPALFALALSIADFLFVAIFFKESLPKKKRAKSVASSLSQASAYINLQAIFQFRAVKDVSQHDLECLKTLGVVYFVYLLIYSGLEFTLTFLTHHIFHYTSMQQGWMFFGIGAVMAFLQGGWVRRLPPNRTLPVACLGLALIIPSFACVGLASFAISPSLLLLGLLLFAVSTAMVVSCMTTLVSTFGPPDQKGTVLGIFRSLGALARAIGPIFASIAFWSVGSTLTYLIGSVFLFWPWLKLRSAKFES